jgi:ribose-phosphate pyrophosphokinase
VIIDDVISTGATITAVASALASVGADPILVCGVHALLDDDDEAIMRAAGVSEIVSCDGVIHPSNAIALASVFAPVLGHED